MEAVVPMRLLDLFCGAGGAARGYADAGFTEIVGHDKTVQENYPFSFVHSDCAELFREWDPREVGRRFDAIHASPPCKAHTLANAIHKYAHDDYIAETRAFIAATGLPGIIENVPGAPLRGDVFLCGSLFFPACRIPEKRGYLKRHRIFEFVNWSPGLLLNSPCCHPSGWRSVGVHGHTGGSSNRSSNHGWTKADWERAMGIGWMTRDELAQAIPPVYTEYLGKLLISRLRREDAA